MIIPKEMSKAEFLKPYTEGLSYKEIVKLLLEDKFPEWKPNEHKTVFNVPAGFSHCAVTYDYNRKKIYKHFISNWNSSYDEITIEDM